MEGKTSLKRAPEPGGVNPARALLDGEELLEVLDVFDEDGLLSHILDHVEGFADAMEDIEG